MPARRSVRVALALGALLGLSVALPAFADFEQEMEDIFGSMVNVTNPDVVQTQSRGVLAGGRVTIKNKVVRPNLITFQPPSLEAGCGGIDLFGGSFSMINKDEFVELLRTIASNAKGYAFQVAMEAMCPTCATTMSELKKTVDDWTKDFRNSCELARSLVDNGIDKLDLEKVTDAQNALRTAGVVDDQGEAMTDPQLFRTAKDNGQAPAFEGNIVWQALHDSEVAAWFVNSDDDFLEALMSLTGTIVAFLPDGQSEPQYTTHSATLDLETILYGDAAGMAVIGANEVSAGARVIRCQNGYERDQCTETAEEFTDLKGMKQRVDEVLFGIEGGGGGLVEKLASNVGPLTPAELSLVSSVKQPIIAMMTDLAQDPVVTDWYLHLISTQIALEVSHTIASDMIDAVKSAVVAANVQGAGPWLTELEHVRRKLDQDYQRISNEQINLEAQLAQYEHVRRSLPVRTSDVVTSK